MRRRNFRPALTSSAAHKLRPPTSRYSNLLCKQSFSFCVVRSFSHICYNLRILGHGLSVSSTARAMLCAVYAMAVCVCLSVCLCMSITSRCSTKMAKRRITQTPPHDSPGSLVFLCQKIFSKFKRGHPQRGRQMQVR